MTTYTRPATWDDVFKVVELLESTGTEFALVGGYAIAAHGFNRFSEDIDVLVNPSDENATRWVAALAQLPDGAARELVLEGNVFQTDKRYALRVNDEITIDVMPSIAGHSWETMKPHRVVREVAGRKIPMLDLHGLLMTKLGERPKDQMDAAVLRAAIERLSS